MSELMSSGELSQLRADIESYTLPDTCNILSVTRTGDSQGGWTESWGTAYVNVKCRLDGIVSSTNNQTIQGQALRDYHQWILTLPHDATINTTSRIEHDSSTYNVVTLIDSGSWLAHVRAIVEQV